MELRTERLVLRLPVPGDADALASVAAHREVVRLMFLPWPYERAHAVDFIRMAQREAEKDVGYHCVIELAAGPILGSVALLNVSAKHRRAELGYWLGRSHWGHGYATEAVWAMLRFGFEDMDLRRIHAATISGNDRSAAVLRRTGFASEGTFRAHLKHRGRWRDLEHWGLMREEWKASRRTGQHG